MIFMHKYHKRFWFRDERLYSLIVVERWISLKIQRINIIISRANSRNLNNAFDRSSRALANDSMTSCSARWLTRDSNAKSWKSHRRFRDLEFDMRNEKKISLNRSKNKYHYLSRAHEKFEKCVRQRVASSRDFMRQIKW